MALPPGVIQLFTALPFFFVPPTVTYALLRIARTEFGIAVPTALTVFLVVFSRLFLSVFQRYYARYKDRRAAAACNAFIMPHVVEKRPAFGGFSIMKALVKDLKSGYPGEVFLHWTEEYGPTYQLRFPTDNRILTFEPDHVKAILATQFDSFEKGPIFLDQFRTLLGDGVFNADDKMWKFHRAMTRPFFTKDRISHFDNFDLHADVALKLANKRLAEGYSIDFQDLVSRFTLDSATQFLFGHDVRSLDAGVPYPHTADHLNTAEFHNHPSNTFANTFLAGQINTAHRTRLGPTWRFAEFWSDRVLPLRAEMDEFTEPLMDKALEIWKKEKDLKSADDDHGDTLLEHLVYRTQDKAILKDELLNLLVAGRDTTACLLTYSFYMMSEHPDVAERLRKEIFAKVGPKNRPTYDDIRDMKYLRAFINEVLRLYPPVPFNSRRSNKAAVWTSKTPGSKPFYVPANTRILYATIYMQRRKDLWGPDAEEFDPDRFLDERLHKYLTPNPYIFCPFNAGPRICIGQQFAYQEASFFLVRLFQQFHNFRLVSEDQPPETRPPASWGSMDSPEWKRKEKICPGTHLTLYVKGGLWGKMDPLPTA